MAIISEANTSTSSAAATSRPPSSALFSATLDRSNPLGLVERVFQFLAEESDFFFDDSAEKEIAGVLRAEKEKSKRIKKHKVEEAAESKVLEDQKTGKIVDDDAVMKGAENVKEKGQGKKDGGKSGFCARNKGNGLDLERYSWTQTPQGVTVNIPVPQGTEERFVACDIVENHLKVGLKGQPPFIEGELYRTVKLDDCYWSVEDRSAISVFLTKHDQMEWWKCLVKGDPEIDIRKVEAETYKLSDLDPDTRETVEKIMFDRRQKAMGLPTSEEMRKQEILKRFMAEHPEMNFWRAKISKGHRLR